MGIKSATNQTESKEVEVELSPQQVGLKVAMDRVLREKSAAKEMSVPRELASQLLNLSSANVSAELKRSCSNIVARCDSTAKETSSTQSQWARMKILRRNIFS